MHGTFKSPTGSYWWPGSYGAPCLNFCHCLGSCWQGVWKRISITGIWRLLDKGQYLLLVQTLCWKMKGEGWTEVVLRLGGCAWNSERGFYWDLQTKHDLKKYYFNFYSAFLLKCRVILNLKLSSSSSYYSNNRAGYHRSPSTEGVQLIHSHLACWKYFLHRFGITRSL